MIGKTFLNAAVLAVSLIAVPAMAQNAVPAKPPAPTVGQPASPPPGAVPPMNPGAYNAINPIRAQWEQARAAYLQAQQAELAARANFDRATTSLLNVMSAATLHPPTTPMPVVVAQPVQGQPALVPAKTGTAPTPSTNAPRP